MTSSSDNVSRSSSTHEADVKHPTSPAEMEAHKHPCHHGKRSRDNSCSHGHKKHGGHHKHHKCHHHHKHKKHRSRSRSRENKSIVTVAKDSSSASEGEAETQFGAKSKSTRKSKSRSKGRSSSSGNGRQSPSKALVTKDTMAFDNRAFSSDCEGLSDGARVEEPEFSEPKRRDNKKDMAYDRDEVF